MERLVGEVVEVKTGMAVGGSAGVDFTTYTTPEKALRVSGVWSRGEGKDRATWT